MKGNPRTIICLFLYFSLLGLTSSILVGAIEWKPIFLKQETLYPYHSGSGGNFRTSRRNGEELSQKILQFSIPKNLKNVASKILQTNLHNTEKESTTNREPNLQLFVQLSDPVTREKKSRVEKKFGISLRHYIPENTYRVYTTLSKAEALLAATNLYSDSNTLRDGDNADYDVIWVEYVNEKYKTILKPQKLERQLEYIMKETENLDYLTTVSSPLTFPSSISQSIEAKNTSTFFKNYVLNMAIPQSRIKLTAMTVVPITDQEKQEIIHALRSLDEHPLSGCNRLIFHVESDDRIVIDTCIFVVGKVLEILTSRDVILWVETQLESKTLNHAANYIIQNGEKNPSFFEIWNKGLKGEGEVVACGDTGIDHDMCFFNDPNHTVSFNSVNFNHRKIVGYFTVPIYSSEGRIIGETDRKDGVNGHGTHVTGSIAGDIVYHDPQRVNELSKFNGVAPRSKLFFIDIQETGGGLTIPQDLYRDYFLLAYNRGNARIFSSSWGCSLPFQCSYDCRCRTSTNVPVDSDFCDAFFGTERCCSVCNQYSLQSLDVDRFLYDYPDATILFAAGNDGSVAETQTLGSPSTAKNGISVGASHTTFDNFKDSAQRIDIRHIISQIGLRDEAECCSFRHSDPSIQDAVRTACCRSYYLQKVESNPEFYNPQNMATFSSRGPTSYFGIKPDIVAPGYQVQSMHSDGIVTTYQCGTSPPNLGNNAAVETKMGTSMATPITAGAVALIRQYYREVQKLNAPSGMLIKATLLHSSQPLSGSLKLDPQGNFVRKLSELTYPNPFTGFGLIQLNKVLKFDDTTEFFLNYKDNQKIEPGKTKVYYFVALRHDVMETMTEPFKVTLAYYDKPTSPGSSDIFTNHVTLEVFVEQRRTNQGSEFSRFVANSGTTGGEGDQRRYDDWTNTAKQVTLRNPSTDTKDLDDRKLLVVVRGKLVEEQSYSIVMTYSGNDFAEVLDGPQPPSPMPFPPTPGPTWIDNLMRVLSRIPIYAWVVAGIMVFLVITFSIISLMLSIIRFRIYSKRKSLTSAANNVYYGTQGDVAGTNESHYYRRESETE